MMIANIPLLTSKSSIPPSLKNDHLDLINKDRDFDILELDLYRAN